MSVYVDDMRAPFGRMIMCHMGADSTEELLAMADSIGVQRKWIQHAGRYTEHFDVSLGARAKAVAAGAIEITQREMCLFDDHRGPRQFHKSGFHHDCPTCSKVPVGVTDEHEGAKQ